MASEIKYEKINSNNIRKWIKSLDLLNKQELQSLKSDYSFIVNMSDVILEKLSTIDPDSIKADAQSKIDEIDALLDLFNNSISSEEIPFIEE